MDGFDHYGSGQAGAANMLQGSWAQVSTFGGPGVPSWGTRTGAFALTSGNTYRYVLPSTQGRVFLSCGFSCDGLPSSNFSNQIVSFHTAANAVIANLWVQADGSITLADGSNTVLATTQGPEIVSRSWAYLEMDFNQAGGDFVLRVNDAAANQTPAINASGLSLGSTAVGQITVAGAGSVTTWIDDLFIRNASGSVNNGFLGDRRVATLLVDADTTTAGWTANRYSKLGAGILNNTSTTSNGASVGAATSTSLNIGSSDFTIETFVRFKSLPSGSNKSVLFSRWDQTNNQRSYELFLGSVALNGGSLCWQTSTDGTGSTITQSIVYPWTPDLDTWYHVAIVRASGELLLFVNGTQFGLPISDSTTYFAGTSPFGIGGELSSSAGGMVANTALTGWFDETRFTNGFARYTTNFTPTVVEFTRGSGDPEWSDVVFLAGYDTLIQDESSFARTLTANNGAVQQTPNDAASVGVWPVIGKASPDDNTFIEAPFTNATSILTLTVNASNTNSVTVGTKDGSTPAVYTFKTSLSTAFDVLIDTNIQNTLQNLFNAINAGPGSGTKYGTGTTANFDVNATQLPAGQMLVTANAAGTAGNSIATSKSGITGGWTSTTLAGGANIPGPSNFKVQRLPSNTTLISAVQVSMRSFKSDAGLGSINSAIVGPLGGVATGSTHALTITPVYYNDIYEADPDTSGPISPTTITNGAIQVNRDV
jgi:hypothetical protein